MPTLTTDDKQKIAAIQIKAMIEREKRIHNAPPPSGPVRVRGRDYKPAWMVLRDWFSYIALHGVAVVGVFTAYFILIIVNTLAVYFIQSNTAALMIVTPSIIAAGLLWRVRKTPHSKASNNLWQRIESYRRGGQFREMANELIKLAEAGNATAQLQLAELYDSGKGVAKNQNRALQWIRQAAKRGRIEAQHELGRRYLFGIGSEVNLTEANKWYTAAANNGLPEAAMSLGHLYEHPRRTEPELDKAAHWYQKASEGFLFAKNVDDARAALAAFRNVGGAESMAAGLEARITTLAVSAQRTSQS